MKHLNILMTLIVVAAVVGIFMMFRPAEPTDLYWVNLVWSIVCFSACTFYFFSARTDGRGAHSSAVSIAIGAYMTLYTALLIVVMTAHFALVEPGVIWTLTSFPSPYARLLRALAPLFQENPELGRGIYYSIFIGGTAIFAVTLAIIMRADKEHIQRERILDEETNTAQDYASQVDILMMKARKSGNSVPLMRLQREIHALTPNVVRIAAARRELDAILSEAEKLVAGGNHESMSAWTDDAVERIKLIKRNSKN